MTQPYGRPISLGASPRGNQYHVLLVMSFIGLYDDSGSDL